MISIEVRTLVQLPRLDLWSLRSTTNARESGLDLRGPDCGLAERGLGALRDQIVAQLTDVGAGVGRGDEGLAATLEQVGGLLGQLTQFVDLIDATLFPRLSDPTITVGRALERAAAARGQAVTVEGDVDAPVAQVRGLLRLLSALIESVGGDAFAHARRDGEWLELTLAPMATLRADMPVAPEHVEALRLAAYLLRIQAEHTEGAWRLVLLLREPPAEP